MQIHAKLAALNVPITRLIADSRLLQKGDIFVAFQGEHQDGRAYIAAAIAAGATAVIWEAQDFVWDAAWQLPNLAVEHLREQAGELASFAYGQPSAKMRTVGVTGTNGKTSCTHWLAQAYQALAMPSAVIGTVGNGFLANLQTASHTTPEPLSLQLLLRDLYAQGAETVSIEVSSHGLDQARVNGVQFDMAVLTNLTRDHLDYHHDMAAYAAAKTKLFTLPNLRVAVLNVDTEFGRRLLGCTSAKQVFTYGFCADAMVRCVSLRLGTQGMCLHISTPQGEAVLNTRLLGRFNAENLLAVLACLLASEVPLSEAIRVLETVQAAAGRMQTLGGHPQPLVVVDYAHTPDALEKVLHTLREMLAHTAGRLIAVVGCGGDRDAGKRPLMGEIVTRLSDVAIMTSDNPRSEDPAKIIQEMTQALPAASYQIILARADAIAYAIAHAQPDDMVLLAGKGHETYQEIAGIRYPFDDVEYAKTALKNRNGQ